MPRRSRAISGAYLFVVAFALLSAAAAPPQAHAHWLTKLVREAGEAGVDAGKTAGKLGLGSVDDAARVVNKLPEGSGGAALAAHATPEGHWQFVNKSGEVYTAGTPAEMGRFAKRLAPDAEKTGRPLSLYLSADTVFEQRALLKDLPADAKLFVVHGADAFPIAKSVGDAASRLHARVRPNLYLALDDADVFSESLWQLSRPLNAADIRVVSLKPGGPQTLSPAPRRNASERGTLVDDIDPWKLPAALPSLRGQTVLVTGRVDGKYLHFQPASGPEKSLLIDDLTKAAADADVNLVILRSRLPAQPGGRNWLWQTVEVEGLDDAMQRATTGDFLNVLGGTGGGLSISGTKATAGRVTLRARPLGAAPEPVSDAVGGWLEQVVSNITGEVVTTAIDLHARSESRQKELDRRIVPGIPSTIQMMFIGGLIFGLLGLAVARQWWNVIWPPEDRSEYSGFAGFAAARTVKWLAFVLLFLPLVGPFAFLWTVLCQIAWIVMAPFRLLRRLFSGSRAQTG